ncbi:hypothetical protein AVEN_31169-1 [Araneus ventricosus]|uniref:PiggyBac transposable element-derived protein domain-containing protein n=1 Tax=Araneus ventricosus TaxID=182803 RepID=A0A4Y2L993_ARAVE|nr:hypothetical protein AVEN_31169-1 [Araneus ventricosus]
MFMKPAVVIDYNLTMGGVVRADQALVCYSTFREPQKRYFIAILGHFLYMDIWKAFLSQKKQIPSMDNYDFRMSLLERDVLFCEISLSFRISTHQGTETTR